MTSKFILKLDSSWHRKDDELVSRNPLPKLARWMGFYKKLITTLYSDPIICDDGFKYVAGVTHTIYGFRWKWCSIKLKKK